MNTQINLRLSDKLLKSAKTYAKKHGFSNVQELIKETLRDKLFPDELTSEEISLAKKIIKVSDKKDLWGTEEELWKTLKSKSMK